MKTGIEIKREKEREIERERVCVYGRERYGGNRGGRR